MNYTYRKCIFHFCSYAAQIFSPRQNQSLEENFLYILQSYEHMISFFNSFFWFRLVAQVKNCIFIGIKLKCFLF